MSIKIIIPCKWKTVDLFKTEDANEFGEALRNYCFIGNCEQTGCYSTFALILQLKEIKSGKIYEEAKKVIHPTNFVQIENSLHVYYQKIIEKDCWIAYNNPEDNPQRMKFCEPQEIVCAWEWEQDGILYFRFNNRKVINTDCKCSYGWKWIE